MNDTEQQLQQAYRNSKRAHPVPGRIRRRILQVAVKRNRIGAPRYWSREWAALAATGFVVLLLVGVYDFKQQIAGETPLTGMNVTLEMHAYEDELADVEAGQYRKKLTAYHRAYAEKLDTFKAASTRMATLVFADEQWTFSDCESNRITISDQLIANLKLHQRIDTDIRIGDQVALALNREGLILQISHSGDIMQC